MDIPAQISNPQMRNSSRDRGLFRIIAKSDTRQLPLGAKPVCCPESNHRIARKRRFCTSHKPSRRLLRLRQRLWKKAIYGRKLVNEREHVCIPEYVSNQEYDENEYCSTHNNAHGIPTGREMLHLFGQTHNLGIGQAGDTSLRF